jgi:hypothetical protein
MTFLARFRKPGVLPGGLLASALSVVGLIGCWERAVGADDPCVRRTPSETLDLCDSSGSDGMPPPSPPGPPAPTPSATSGSSSAGAAGAAMTALPPEPPEGSYAWPCPSTAPKYLDPCTVPSSDIGDYCVYAPWANPIPECNQTFFCSGGVSRFGNMPTWFEYEPSSVCASAPDGGNECPADYAVVMQGSACTVETFCSYPQGLCACTTGPSDGPQHAPQWVCATPPVATPSGTCPTKPPLEGMACSAIERDCDWGSCTIQSAPTLHCKKNAQGNWAWTRGAPTRNCH